jgi:CheY-like chemotaxis protein
VPQREKTIISASRLSFAETYSVGATERDIDMTPTAPSAPRSIGGIPASWVAFGEKAIPRLDPSVAGNSLAWGQPSQVGVGANLNSILVVDDDADMRESLRDALVDEGYTVLLASNGQEALDLLPSLQRPCGIILDIAMPVMTGTEFYGAMRAVPIWADIPVLILTSDPSRAPRGLPMMKKTVNLERMLATVAALF